jgi:hypothetical protein
MRRWSSRRIGLPAPGTMSAPAKAPHPAGVPCIALAHRSDSVSDPLVGFGPPTRYFPKSPPAASRPRAPLLGFLAPSAHWEERVHGPPVTRRAPRFCRDSAGGSHPASYGAAHRFSQPLSGLPSSLRRPAIFRQVALLGFHPSGGYSCHATPTARHRRHALLTFLPNGWPSPILGGGTSGRAARVPRNFAGAFSSSSGLSSAWKSAASPRHG